MLKVTLPAREWFNEETEEFIVDPPVEIELEHSLLSIANWEAKHKRPFYTLLKDGGLTSEELLDYFGFMIQSPPISVNEILVRFSYENFQAILLYLDDSQTATTIHERENTPESKRFITAELIYTWMIGLQIEKSYETWNINRLLTLIRTASIELNSDRKKMSRKQAAAYQRSANARNKARLHTKG